MESVTLALGVPMLLARAKEARTARRAAHEAERAAAKAARGA